MKTTIILTIILLVGCTRPRSEILTYTYPQNNQPRPVNNYQHYQRKIFTDFLAEMDSIKIIREGYFNEKNGNITVKIILNEPKQEIYKKFSQTSIDVFESLIYTDGTLTGWAGIIWEYYDGNVPSNIGSDREFVKQAAMFKAYQEGLIDDDAYHSFIDHMNQELRRMGAEKDIFSHNPVKRIKTITRHVQQTEEEQ